MLSFCRYIYADSVIAAGEENKALSDSVIELEKLANDTEKGKVTFVKQL
jgi:hypothetical protein